MAGGTRIFVVGGVGNQVQGRACPSSPTTQVARNAVRACCLLASLLLVVLPVPGTGAAQVLTGYPASVYPASVSPGPSAVSHQLPARSLSPEPFVDESSDCGLTRTIRVRTLDGSAVVGVTTVRLEARPASSGGPETYRDRTEGCPPNARPVLTGTVRARTDATGRARFERLGRGLWSMWMEGAVDGLPIVQREVQGVPPYGTNPDGNGHLELLDAFNEHVGDDASGEPDEPGASAEPVIPMLPLQISSTSSYVLLPSERGWVPALDLAEGSAPSMPLPSFPELPKLPTPSPVGTLSTQEVVETAGPSRDTILRGTPVVVGTVAIVGTLADGAALPGGSTHAGVRGGRIGDRVLFLLGAALLGFGLLWWAASHTRTRWRQKEPGEWGE